MTGKEKIVGKVEEEAKELASKEKMKFRCLNCQNVEEVTNLFKEIVDSIMSKVEN